MTEGQVARDAMNMMIRYELTKGKIKKPSLKSIERSFNRSGLVKAVCPKRCKVEIDGTCPHGRPSWLYYLGLA